MLNVIPKYLPTQSLPHSYFPIAVNLLTCQFILWTPKYSKMSRTSLLSSEYQRFSCFDCVYWMPSKILSSCVIIKYPMAMCHGSLKQLLIISSHQSTWSSLHTAQLSVFFLLLTFTRARWTCLCLPRVYPDLFIHLLDGSHFYDLAQYCPCFIWYLLQPPF